MIQDRYFSECEFIKNMIIEAYGIAEKRTNFSCIDKKAFDIVTSVDFDIERFIIKKINERYPKDNILSEETKCDTQICGRTWTIDPIDGTYNYACNIPLFGIQCALFDENEIVVSVIYLPTTKEMYSAVLNGGAYLNDNRIAINKTTLDKCIVSFGDFPHSRPADAFSEKKIICSLSDKVARIRMFGAASVDFAYLASGKTNGVVIFTKNKWDISPGILLCKEAGAIMNGETGDYSFDSRVVIATSQIDLTNLILSSF